MTVKVISPEVAERLRERARDHIYLLADSIQICMDRCSESPSVDGWDWTRRKDFRFPPLPYYSRRAEKGRCRICWLESGKVTWHKECAAAYNFFTSPRSDLLGWIQDFICPGCGDAIGRASRYVVAERPASTKRNAPTIIEWSGWNWQVSSAAEADHIKPLYLVRREYTGEPWHELLRYWSPLNLQALCRECHLRKCATEAAERAAFRVHGRSDMPHFLEAAE